MRVDQTRKKPFKWYGVVRRTICMKKVYRGDPEGAVRGSKKAFWRKYMY